MSSSCCFEHSPIIDSSTATIVCENCARVLEEGLTHFEVNQQKYHITAKLHLHQSSIDIAHCSYNKNTNKIENTLNHPHKKPSLLSPENVLIYSIV